MDTIKLTIDNRVVEVPKGTTILKAAEQMGIRIPTLCNFELEGLALKNHPGGCRICVVEVVGRRNLAPACITECMPDMVVRTNSPRAINARKTVLELMLSDHPNDCLLLHHDYTLFLLKFLHLLFRNMKLAWSSSSSVDGSAGPLRCSEAQH